jgi:hypothetical protein
MSTSACSWRPSLSFTKIGKIRPLELLLTSLSALYVLKSLNYYMIHSFYPFPSPFVVLVRRSSSDLILTALRWKSDLVRNLYTLAFSAPLVLGIELFEQKQKLTVELFDYLVYLPVRFLSTECSSSSVFAPFNYSGNRYLFIFSF